MSGSKHLQGTVVSTASRLLISVAFLFSFGPSITAARLVVTCWSRSQIELMSLSGRPDSLSV